MSNDREDLVVDRLQMDYAEHIQDGDELRNINSFEYLKNIANRIPESLDIYPFNFLRQFFHDQADYMPDHPYGDLYTQILLDLEHEIPHIHEARQQIEHDFLLKQEQVKTHRKNMESETIGNFAPFIRRTIAQTEAEILSLNALLSAIDTGFDMIYANPNKALERSATMVKDIIEDEDISHTSPDIESSVRDRMKGKGTTKIERFKDDMNYITSYRDKNKTTPQQEGSNTGRFKSMISSTFKPQTTTSMASIREYQYKEGRGLPVEYRFGTQGQYHEKRARVSPTFEFWLQAQQRKRDSNPPPLSANKTRITHIYFNNLGLDRSDYEGSRERRLSEQLHGLEDRHDNIAVITLPADKGLMDKHLLDDHTQSIDVDEAYGRILNIATGTITDPDPDPTKDFHISNDIKMLLYGTLGETYDAVNERTILDGLLNQTMEKFGFDGRTTLSPAEMQAVYFHFIKYELTNFIIEKLKPESFNMSCKDAIDRGGVSSAYYNVMKSLELRAPLSKDEFYRALHAAPALVKGRGMNHHTRLIWNAVDAYLTSASEKPINPPDWLVEWRNKNAPSNSRLSLIGQLETYIQERDNDERMHHSILGKHDKDTKLSAARKLLAIIKNPEIDTEFTPKEWAALNQGRLSKICDEINKRGLIDLKALKPVEEEHGMKV